MRACICCKGHDTEECAECAIALRNNCLLLRRCPVLDPLWWVSKLSGKCFPKVFSLHSVCCNSPSLFPKSLLSPWVIWMESGRGAWDKLSMATSLTATLDPKPFKVFAWIPSISCILYVPFQVSCILEHHCHMMTNSYSMRVHGFAAQLVKAE